MNAIAEKWQAEDDALGSIPEIERQVDTMRDLLREIGIAVGSAELDKVHGVVSVAFLSTASLGYFLSLAAEYEAADDDLLERITGQGPACENDDWRYGVKVLEKEASRDRMDKGSPDQDGCTLIFSVSFSVYDLPLVMKRAWDATEAYRKEMAEERARLGPGCDVWYMCMKLGTDCDIEHSECPDNVRLILDSGLDLARFFDYVSGVNFNGDIHIEREECVHPYVTRRHTIEFAVEDVPLVMDCLERAITEHLQEGD